MEPPAPPRTERPAAPPGPPPERDGWPVPEGIAELHDLLVILSTYGRHLCDTLRTRAARRDFATIAQYFGTAAVGTIIAHLCRGLMRCQALDRMLRDRVKRGVDLKVIEPRAPRRAETPDGPEQTTDDPPPETPAAAAPAAETAAPPLPLTEAQQAEARAKEARTLERRLARQFAATHPLTLATLPTMAEIEADVRRCPVGQTIALICRDFGISPALCAVPFWNRLFDGIRRYGGNLAPVILALNNRAAAFERTELDRSPHLGWPAETREGAHRVLGFFIGEDPVAPERPDWMPPSDALFDVPPPVEGFTVVATGPP